MKKKIYGYLLFLLGLIYPASGMASGFTEVPAEFTGPTWYDYRDTSFSYEGKGSLNNPIVITTAEQLAQFSYLFNENPSRFEKKVVVLGADINLNRTEGGKRIQWIPIGYNSNYASFAFFGVDTRNMADGEWSSAQPHTISGMYINVDYSKSQYETYGQPVHESTFGLFAAIYNSFIGYLNIKDAEMTIDYSNSVSLLESFAGVLVGRSQCSAESTINISDGENTVYVPSAIDGVSVEGNIKVTGTGRTTYKECVGGISGIERAMGISHSTFKGRIDVTNEMCVGGITGYIYGSDIIDCAADADITSSSSIEPRIGGIVGLNENSYQAFSQARRVEACVSMGSIKCSKDNQQRHIVGGICGYQGQHIAMLGCSSTMLISSYGNVGGLVGRMQKINGSGDASDGTYHYKDSKIECCSFGGHIDGSLAHTDNKGQVIDFDSSITDNYVGGLCGYLEWDDNHEHILRCLFVGTMMNSNWDFPSSESVTVGYGQNIESTVTYCYYDNNMYTRKTCPDNQANPTIIGLPTKDLTTGTSAKISNLNINESDPYGFKLAKGSYPIPYSNNSIDEQRTACEQNNNAALSALAKRMFSWNEMNTQNSVYTSGANLCATPVQFSDGDAADYFVAELTMPTKTTTWQETGTGRDINLVAECLFPESEYISVKDKTATANNTGNCIITIEGTSKAKSAATSTAYDRPVPLGGSKILGLRAETNKVWSGEEADAYAGGSGTAADPYLIKNGEQLIHAIKHNSEGQFFKQICDITICRKSEFSLITIDELKNSLQPVPFIGSHQWDASDCEWKATYDGNGHLVKGLTLMNTFERFNTSLSLFGNVGTNGTIKNLGVTDSWIDYTGTEGHSISFGMIASEVSGEIYNCLTQGIDVSGRPCGGICAYVKSGGKVEDCISAVYTLSYSYDAFTPFVAYDNTDNTGTVSNCLVVTPIRMTSDRSISEMNCINDCYWLKGYGNDDTGMTLDEIGAALSSRNRWTWEKGFFPTLKTFKGKDIAALMTTPIRTDEADEHLFRMTKMLEFNPGTATWTSVHGTDYIDADSELGIIVPTDVMPGGDSYNVLRPVEYICSMLNNTFYYIPILTSRTAVEKGITFVDSNAETACVAAFDNNNDGKLSLSELRAVTTEMTLHAFDNETGRQIVKFPEFRFFKSVTTLTTQLNGLTSLEEVSLPCNLTTIGGKDGSEYITPFNGCTSLTKMTIPTHVSTVGPGAFYLSAIDSIFVDSLNPTFVSREGILFNKNDELVSYPNGRNGEDIVLSGTIESILEGAIYKVDGLRNIYFDTTDYETVADLETNGIVSDNGELIDVYICDATYGSVLYNEYLDDESWEDYVDASKLHYYYPLKIGSAKAATLYIGFDTELPAGLRSYIVTESVFNETVKTAYLKRTSNKIPNRSPIVIFADAPGTYRLYPLDGQLSPWNMYVNKLNGVGRDGLEVNQSDSDRGSILTLGRNSNGVLGFFYYTSTEKIPPYRAYLTYEWVTSANLYFLFQIIDDDTTGINGIQHISDNGQQTNSDAWYTISGHRLTGMPSTKGVYIHNGEKIVVK